MVRPSITLWQNRQKSLGLCIKCTQPAVTASYCERHRLITNAFRKRWNERQPGYTKAWRAANPGKTSEYSKRHRAKRRAAGLCLTCNSPSASGRTHCTVHALRKRSRNLGRRGTTIEDFARVVRTQEGKCRICTRTRRLVADHDHRTGGFRGALCHPCNLALGAFDDDPVLLEAAAAYLREAIEHRWPVMSR